MTAIDAVELEGTSGNCASVGSRKPEEEARDRIRREMNHCGIICLLLAQQLKTGIGKK